MIITFTLISCFLDFSKLVLHSFSYLLSMQSEEVMLCLLHCLLGLEIVGVDQGFVCLLKDLSILNLHSLQRDGIMTKFQVFFVSFLIIDLHIVVPMAIPPLTILHDHSKP